MDGEEKSDVKSYWYYFKLKFMKKINPKILIFISSFILILILFLSFDNEEEKELWEKEIVSNSTV